MAVDAADAQPVLFIVPDKSDFKKFDYLTTIDIFDAGYDYIGLVSFDKYYDKFISNTKKEASLKQQQSNQLKYPQLPHQQLQKLINSWFEEIPDFYSSNFCRIDILRAIHYFKQNHQKVELCNTCSFMGAEFDQYLSENISQFSNFVDGKSAVQIIDWSRIHKADDLLTPLHRICKDIHTGSHNKQHKQKYKLYTKMYRILKQVKLKHELWEVYPLFGKNDLLLCNYIKNQQNASSLYTDYEIAMFMKKYWECYFDPQICVISCNLLDQISWIVCKRRDQHGWLVWAYYEKEIETTNFRNTPNHNDYSFWYIDEDDAINEFKKLVINEIINQIGEDLDLKIQIQTIHKINNLIKTYFLNSKEGFNAMDTWIEFTKSSQWKQLNPDNEWSELDDDCKCKLIKKSSQETFQHTKQFFGLKYDRQRIVPEMYKWYKADMKSDRKHLLTIFSQCQSYEDDVLKYRITELLWNMVNGTKNDIVLYKQNMEWIIDIRKITEMPIIEWECELVELFDLIDCDMLAQEAMIRAITQN